MNIKEVEKLTDISSQNIRFYEKHGLITPSRNSENGYREYTEKDVQRLKLIKMFRMIDMPVEEIRHILSQEKSLSDSLKSQQALLKLKLEETKYALQMCEEIHEKYPSVQDIDVDKCLSVMNEEPSHFFSSWIDDYKDVVEYDHQRTFTFMPDVEITDKYSFLNALYAYAMETDKEIVITKESMYPEFLLDGVPYTAERFFETVRGIPVSVIHCTRNMKGSMLMVERNGYVFSESVYHIVFSLFSFLLLMETGLQKKKAGPGLVLLYLHALHFL